MNIECSALCVRVCVLCACVCCVCVVCVCVCVDIILPISSCFAQRDSAISHPMICHNI